MAIITTSEVKAILQLDGSKDTFIDTVIPHVQNFIVEKINSFKSSKVYLAGSSLAFVASTKKITDSNSAFVTSMFVAGDYLVENSYYNDGVITVSTVAAGELTISTTPIDEAADRYIVISKIDWPPGIKNVVAKMINHLMSKSQISGVTSESLGDWSASYGGDGDYPKNILSDLNKYRKLSW